MADILLDANLLVVLAIGQVDPSRLGLHKRARAYRPEDFDTLVALLDGYSALVVCPNTLTEASNLLRSSDPSGTLSASLAELASGAAERWVASAPAMQRGDYLRLGLTDSVLLTLAGSGADLLTADLDLYLAALTEGFAAHNFNYLRSV